MIVVHSHSCHVDVVVMLALNAVSSLLADGVCLSFIASSAATVLTSKSRGIGLLMLISGIFRVVNLHNSIVSLVYS